MSDPKAESGDPSVRFDQMEVLLQSYPDISDDELQDLKRWFTKEASSFQIASMASKKAIEPNYRKFRADHIDKFSFFEGIIATVVVLIVAALIISFI